MHKNASLLEAGLLVCGRDLVPHTHLHLGRAHLQAGGDDLMMVMMMMVMMMMVMMLKLTLRQVTTAAWWGNAIPSIMVARATVSSSTSTGDKTGMIFRK